MKVLDALVSLGLLLRQDKRLPNVVTLVTGESLRASWWSHPSSPVIFAVLSELSEHPDVLFTKLLFGKVTLVHRRLWPAFLAVASAGEPWQLRSLSVGARRLLQDLQRATAPVRCSGAVVRELEARLLAHAEEIHTETGRHAMALERWPAWSRRVGARSARSVPQGRKALERAAQALGAPLSALPWSSA